MLGMSKQLADSQAEADAGQSFSDRASDPIDADLDSLRRWLFSALFATWMKIRIAENDFEQRFLGIEGAKLPHSAQRGAARHLISRMKKDFDDDHREARVRGTRRYRSPK